MNMKKLLRRVACVLFAMVALVSCVPDMGMPDFSVDDIYGKWKSGTLYYRYDHGYKGVTWDIADDVAEEEAQPFTWEIVGDDMTHIHIMEMSANIFKTYVIDELTPTVLSYHDTDEKNGKQYHFTKVAD